MIDGSIQPIDFNDNQPVLCGHPGGSCAPPDARGFVAPVYEEGDCPIGTTACLGDHCELFPDNPDCECRSALVQ